MQPCAFDFILWIKIPYFATQKLHKLWVVLKGPLAEWLGKALQKLLQRFESARDLLKPPRHSPGRSYSIYVMLNKFAHYTGLLSCIAMVIACFLPWTHYNNINETFTGFHVIRFSTGNYYGKAGAIITVFTAIIFVFMLLPKIWAKRTNLFIAALLFAYCIRTYIIFTSALFAGEVDKKIGIYLILILSTLIMITAAFPIIGNKKAV